MVTFSWLHPIQVIFLKMSMMLQLTMVAICYESISFSSQFLVLSMSDQSMELFLSTFSRILLQWPKYHFCGCIYYYLKLMVACTLAILHCIFMLILNFIVSLRIQNLQSTNENCEKICWLVLNRDGRFPVNINPHNL